MKKHYKYHFIVAIGRCEPFHNGHQSNFIQGLDIAEKLIVILGSANKPRSIENPFTIEERKEYILKSMPEKYRSRILFNSVEDTIYTNLEWVQRVQMAVHALVLDYFPGSPPLAKIAIIGHHKDRETSNYLDQFKNWDQIEAAPYIKEKNGGIPVSATKIRELMFTNYLGYVQSNVPPAMYEWLSDFTTTEAFANLQAEYNSDYAYLPTAHEKMVNGEWATNFYTADGWVFQSGHVLLVKRKYNPGKGLWASPGGHVGSHETAFEAVIREIYEETNLKVPEKVLRGSLVGEKLFDHPNRSLRGKTRSKNCRTVNVSFCFKLDDSQSLAHVHHGDDAEEAWWYTLGEVATMRSIMFEDHPDQCKYWTGQIEK